MESYRLFAACPVYLEDLLEQEVLALGGTIDKRTRGGLAFSGTLETIYEFSLKTRIAGHLLLKLHEFEVDGLDSIAREAAGFDWSSVMRAGGSFSCRSTMKRSSLNQKMAALKLKDGIADYWREKTGERPDVDRENPEYSYQVHVFEDSRAELYLDLSGDTLSNRGYRLDTAKAALRENTAAALLLRSGWPELSEKGAVFADPMCGSGTILVEAAMIAGNLPSQLFRSHYGFLNWTGHDQDLWEDCMDRAEQEWKAGLEKLPRIVGFDHDRHAVAAAAENIRRAGLDRYIHVEKRELSDFVFTEALKAEAGGLMLTNPPYGQRIGDKGTLYSLYRELGDLVRRPDFDGWQLSVISDDRSLIKSIGLKSSRENRVMNGALSCTLVHYELFSSPRGERGPSGKPEQKVSVQDRDWSEEGRQFLNRLIKRRKHLNKWMKREEVSCCRIYDADLPNFNFAIDVYENKWIHVQEYKAPSSVDQAKAEKRIAESVEILGALYEIPKYQIYLKQRRRQKGQDQYKSLSSKGERYLINEWGQRIWVNFTDYLDTGIFLDHRNIRRWIKENSEGKSLLNLFSYTCTASLMAAAGGAEKIVSVDSSRAYLSWGQDNFALNKYDRRDYRFERSDSFQFLRNSRDYFDLIFLDPPTFSNSKSRASVFDVQSDHEGLIHLCMKRLKRGGTLIFSNNYRQFEMSEKLTNEYSIKEVSSWSVSEDFKGKKNGHRCWFISFPGEGV
ncbi:MAG: bifunctional 23S rRNA (guanine(2069)-N(7))-methyltransferase RlmK/23S rRNA (guanine(2445)-N(2))-methyltransferase RlmL [Spirochaetales bacterium]|nr:bifunctional 23S rRNA (guanine(2069)-N(7))-methyltransferase RlmK/23S rRNA (guanine(2445)-N(2))-methyltransferase RlmL [Spirochaetales bacterium]